MNFTIKDIYDHVFEGVQPTTAENEQFRQEIIRLMRPLESRLDWNDLADLIMEVSAVSQEYGFTAGFKLGVKLMVECME